MEKLKIIDYSDRAIAVVGYSKKYYKDFMKLHGKWNNFLNIEGEKTPGWVFSKKRREEIESLL